MFGSVWIRPPPHRLEYAMALPHQPKPQRPRDPAPPADDAAREHWLTTETTGRERFRSLLQHWLKANGWSLAVTSRLAELALLAKAGEPIPDWMAGMPLSSGSWVNHRGHAWEAIGEPRSEPAADNPGWREVGLTSRLHASGINLFLRGKNRTLTSTFFLEVGRLNEWIAAVQAGKAPAPQEVRLQELVSQATVLRDEEGVLGPEEMLSIAVGRLMPPTMNDPEEPPASAASVEAMVPARALRAAAAHAGLDIIEDWQQIAELYPTDDPQRLSRLQQVLLGQSHWSTSEAEDEHLASQVLLQQLNCLQVQQGKTAELPTTAS